MEYHVSNLSFLMMGVSLIFAVAMPVALFFFLKKKYNCKIVPFFVGCAVMLLFALVLEQILHMVVLMSPLGDTLTNNIWLYALYGGLAAGIFEETGRFLAMKFVLKSYHSNNSNALMYGAGHGGFEVTYILGISMINNIVISAMINSGGIDAVLGQLPAEAYDQMIASVEALCTTDWWMFLLGILERCIAIVLQVSLSVIVWFAVKNGGKYKLYFPLAIVIHFFADALIVVVNSYAGTAAAEGVTLAVSMACAIFASIIYRKNGGNQ